MSRPSPASAAARRLIQRASVWLGCATGASLLLALGWPAALRPGVTAATGGWLLFSGFVLYFFRDPTARVPGAHDVIVSPAHGLVDAVDETAEPEFMRGRCRRVSIFLSVLDVHVQNAPVAGKVIFQRHWAGEFLNALRAESAQRNENQLIGIESAEKAGERVAVRQVAGTIARRIVSWVREGDTVVRGQRLGLIQFGSRCDLYLPLSTHITVKPGDHVVGGESVVAARSWTPGCPSNEPEHRIPIRHGGGCVERAKSKLGAPVRVMVREQVYKEQRTSKECALGLPASLPTRSPGDLRTGRDAGGPSNSPEARSVRAPGPDQTVDTLRPALT